MMAEPETLAAMYHEVMLGFVHEGRAPHYTELAAELGLEHEAARQTLHQLTGMGLPNWLYPGTDLIASFAPFSNLPNQYHVRVDGEPGWYAQCGFEALALSWLFPGGEVRVDTPCLDCGEPVGLSMRDGQLHALDPAGAVGHSNLPPYRWREDYGRA